MKDNLVETLIGAAVLAVAGLFFMFAYNTANVSSGGDTIDLTARFQNATGIAAGTDVRMAGIKVGTVVSTELDSATYQAVVKFSVDKAIEVPEDSSLSIASEGLLGGSYLSLEPGGSFDLLASGDEVEYTQGYVDLMGLIGQAVFSFTSDEGDGSAEGDASGTDAP